MGNAFLTLVVLILIVYGWIFVEIKLLLRPYPELFGYVFYLQEEADMTPQFEVQDVILVKKDADYRAGDIVLYFDGKDSKFKVHNVVSHDASLTVTKCATCEANNPAVTNDHVIGKATGKVMFMGAIVAFFSQKIVLILFAVVGVAFLVVSQYFEYKPKTTMVREEVDGKKEINSEKK